MDIDNTNNDVVATTDDQSLPVKVYTVKDLLFDRRYLGRTMTLCFLWFSTSLMAYGSDLNSRNLGGNFFLNQFIMGILIGVSKLVSHI